MGKEPRMNEGERDPGRGGAQRRPHRVADHDLHPVAGIASHPDLPRFRSWGRGCKCERSGAAPLVSAESPRILAWRDRDVGLHALDDGMKPMSGQLSLRVTLIAVALAAGAYAAALPLYLFFPVSRPALAPGAPPQTITPPGAALGRTPLQVSAGTALPPELGTALASIDGALSRVGNVLEESVAQLESGRRAAAAARLVTVEQLLRAAHERGADGNRVARAYLTARQRALQAVAGEVRRDTILWLGLGALLVPLLILVVRRRVWRPLRELEAGLTQVADGDLTVGVPVRGSDELGRLAEHFNAMTRVLRDRAEEQGRFAAAGELLAGVAHEVNNPLMAIAAHAENRLADAAFEGEQRSEMTQILRQARRATKLLRGLLRFVRATEREVTNVNLNDVVRGALDLVSYRFGVDEITVGGRLDANLPPVQGDAIKLEQVVVNLLSNAIDALRAVTPPDRKSVV